MSRDNMLDRRKEGEFYTPDDVAIYGRQLLLRLAPQASLLPWWDPCAGGGALTRNFDHPQLYLSTLLINDLPTLQRQHPSNKVFQYDFLNQFEGMLPQPWPSGPFTIFMNPPFAAPAGGFGVGNSPPRSGIAKTMMQKLMKEMGLRGCILQSLADQFICRAAIHAAGGVLGVFTKTDILQNTSKEDLRQYLNSLDLAPIGGFCFSSGWFKNTSNSWGCCFLVLAPGGDYNWLPGLQILGRINDQLQQIGTRIFSRSTRPLSKLVARPDTQKGIEKERRPPMNGWQMYTGKPQLDRWVRGSLVYIRYHANDVQHGDLCTLTSGPNNEGKGWSVFPENLFDSLVCLALRRLVKHTWLNDSDGFNRPNHTLAGCWQWCQDLQVYALFHAGNQTSSLGDVKYKDKIYDIPNHLFWVDPKIMANSPGITLPLLNQVQLASPRAGSIHLNGLVLSPTAAEVLRLGRQLVTAGLSNRPNAYPKYQLNRWDAGWYQVTWGLYKDTPFTVSSEAQALWQKFKAVYKVLGDELRPGLYTYGVLPNEGGVYINNPGVP